MVAALCLPGLADARAVAVGYNEDAVRLVAGPRAVKRSNVQVLRVGFLFQRLWSPFHAGDGLGAWDAGNSALTPDARPRRLYAQIGSLHRGFRGLPAPASGSGLVVGQVPPVPVPGGFAIPPCPQSG